MKTVLVLSDWYLPGFQAGGPVRALANLVHALGDEFRFRVITRDRDLGGSAPYPGTTTGRWTPLGKGEVLYLPSISRPGELLRELSYDLLYLNSAFSPRFTVAPLWRRRRGQLPDRPVLLAPRGEFSRGALALKALKKRIYLALARRLGLYDGIVWQASAGPDREDILREFPSARVEMAPDLPSPLPPACLRPPKPAGRLRALLVARIARIKNVVGAIATLRGIAGDVRLTVIGPIEDPAYWEECQASSPPLPIDYLGPLPPADVSRAMASHDLFVLPSQGENFGHVIFESLAAGCPVLISDRTPWRGLQAVRAGWDVPLEDDRRMKELASAVAAMDEASHSVWREGARAYAEAWLRTGGAIEQNRRLLHAALDG